MRDYSIPFFGAVTKEKHPNQWCCTRHLLQTRRMDTPRPYPSRCLQHLDRLWTQDILDRGRVLLRYDHTCNSRHTGFLQLLHIVLIHARRSGAGQR